VLLACAALALGDIATATEHYLATLDQEPRWDLIARVGLLVLSIYQGQHEQAAANLAQVKELLQQRHELRTISSPFAEGVETVIAALEGKVDLALANLQTLNQAPALYAYRSAYRLVRFMLFLLAGSPHPFDGQGQLLAFFDRNKDAR
jgi:hypothetical protein